MASRTVGNQFVARNQRMLAATNRATMSWTKSSRPIAAREKAATPRAVNGCQAVGKGTACASQMSDGSGLDSSLDIRPSSFRLGLLALVGRRHHDEVDGV